MLMKNKLKGARYYKEGKTLRYSASSIIFTWHTYDYLLWTSEEIIVQEVGRERVAFSHFRGNKVSHCVHSSPTPLRTLHFRIYKMHRLWKCQE